MYNSFLVLIYSAGACATETVRIRVRGSHICNLNPPFNSQRKIVGSGLNSKTQDQIVPIESLCKAIEMIKKNDLTAFIQCKNTP